MRTLLIALLVTLVAPLPLAGASSAVGTFQYLVDPDPRECPSPLCGGYWVSLANHARTTCHDGIRRARCYVTTAVDEQGRQLEGGVPGGAVVRADITRRQFGALGKLGVLVVADIRAPYGGKRNGPVYRVRDLGIRCVRAPCFSLRARRLNAPLRISLSGLDLNPAQLSSSDRARAEAALTSTNGLFVSGRIVTTSDGGRVLRVSRVYLKAATPRG